MRGLYSLLAITAIILVSCSQQNDSQNPIIVDTIVDAPENEMPVTLVTTTDQAAPKIQVVFLLDATGSMSGLIETAKNRIWSIANTLTQTEQTPEISVGLIFYRDRGDHFVTTKTPITQDLDLVYAKLMEIEAAGGGDMEESVNQALHESVWDMAWDDDRETYKTIFLVGDAPPHMDYEDDVKYMVSCRQAREKDIMINTIQLGNIVQTTPIWEEIASCSSGEFMKIEQDANDVSISTPYDSSIVELSKALDETKVYYGDQVFQEQQELKEKTVTSFYMDASETANTTRAIYNCSDAGKVNFLGQNELIEAVANGDIKLDSLSKDQLPKEMQEMSLAQQKRHCTAMYNQRSQIMKQISELNLQRDAFIDEELVKLGETGEASFNETVYKTIKEQCKTKKIEMKGKAKY